MNYEFVDHMCKFCGGRILTITRDGQKIFECARCRLHAPKSYKKLCCCGVVSKNNQDMLLRCTVNEKHAPGKSAEIVVTEIPKINKEVKKAKPPKAKESGNEHQGALF